MGKTLPKKDNEKNIKTTSGKNPNITALKAAFSILTKMSNNIEVVIGGQDKLFFIDNWNTLNNNTKYIKENVLNKESYIPRQQRLRIRRGKIRILL